MDGVVVRIFFWNYKSMNEWMHWMKRSGSDQATNRTSANFDTNIYTANGGKSENWRRNLKIITWETSSCGKDNEQFILVCVRLISMSLLFFFSFGFSLRAASANMPTDFQFILLMRLFVLIFILFIYFFLSVRRCR